METMANDTGMPYSTDSINEYLIYLAENNLLIADDQIICFIQMIRLMEN